MSTVKFIRRGSSDFCGTRCIKAARCFRPTSSFCCRADGIPVSATRIKARTRRLSTLDDLKSEEEAKIQEKVGTT